MSKILWMIGLSGAGKTTLANKMDDITLLDGDIVRAGLCKGLGFSKEDRTENLRRIAEVAKILRGYEHDVLVSCITPMAMHREMIKEIIPDVKFIYVNANIENCIKNDVKGLYKQKLPNFTGITGSWEPPCATDVDLVLNTSNETIEASVSKLKEFKNKL